MDHAARLGALAGSIDLPLLVACLPNVRYLSGFTGSNAYLLVQPGGGGAFVTDGRYGEAAEPLVASLPGVDLVVYTGSLWETMGSVLGGLDRVGLEVEAVTWDFSRKVAEEAGVEPVPTSGVVERMRRSKDPAEVDALRSAAAAGDAAFGAIRALIGGATTEADLAWSLTDEMRRQGGEPADWEPIVAAGPGASIPHYRSGNAPVSDGLLLLDFGCIVAGYHSDMSRTIWLGERPHEELSRVHRAVAESQQAGIEAVRPGVGCGDVDEAVRAVLRTYGYEERFLHSTGHGVGLEIHEEPWVRRGSEVALAAGDVITIEPGVYLPGVGGVRIEDMVLVTEDGPVVLTESSREMMPE